MVTSSPRSKRLSPPSRVVREDHDRTRWPPWHAGIRRFTHEYDRFAEERDVTNTPERSTSRIVVGVDGSASSVAALHWAARQAELTGSQLELITAWEWPTTYGAPIAFAADYVPADAASQVLEVATEMVREDHPAVAIQTRAVEGHPAPVLVAASEGADLLVVGCRGHGEFVGMVLGSVSEHCVASAHCPVLVLRGKG
jgi:nucleotide-binding universal stress UspA family protein